MTVVTKAISARLGEQDIVDIDGLLTKMVDIHAGKLVGFVRIAATAKWMNTNDVIFVS